MERTPSDRKNFQLRPLSIETGVNRYAEGSALIKMGHTHVLCTASLEDRVPGWLEGKNRGWITAEYSMLPRSTHTRSRRDREKISGRTQEIQRLIGRALRSTCRLDALGERTVTIDCDVLQADGGTRTASINGGFVALAIALQKAAARKILPSAPLLQTVSAISVGIKDSDVLTDLDYVEDSSCDVDMNFVITGKGDFVEVQGTAEGQPFSHGKMTEMTEAALAAAKEIEKFQKDAAGLN